jgi:hypothetical protein
MIVDKQLVSPRHMAGDDEVAIGHWTMAMDENSSDLSGCCGEIKGWMKKKYFKM